MSHLDALELRLSNERIRLANAKTQAEKDLRAVWVAQLEKEIQGEREFVADSAISDEELLAALGL